MDFYVSRAEEEKLFYIHLLLLWLITHQWSVYIEYLDFYVRHMIVFGGKSFETQHALMELMPFM